MQGEMDVDLENIQGRIAEWIVQPSVERKVRRVFVAFLLTYEDDEGNKVYQQRIKDMQSSEWSIRADYIRENLCRRRRPTHSQDTLCVYSC